MPSSGHPSFRYLRSSDDRDRVQKIYMRFGRDTFTVRDLKSEVLPDINSGQIASWNSSNIIESVGKESSVNIWKLSEGVIETIIHQLNGEL